MKVTETKVDHYVTLRFSDGDVFTLKDMVLAVSALLDIARDSGDHEDDHTYFGDEALRLLKDIDKAIQRDGA